MNTCCENTTNEATTTVATTNEASTTPATNFVQPQWRAHKNDEGVKVEVVLPGVKRDDLKVEAQGPHLHLEAVRPAADDAAKLVYGSPAPEGYRLKLRIADSLDTEKLTARLSDGILQVEIPLVDAAQPKRIEIL